MAAKRSTKATFPVEGRLGMNAPGNRGTLTIYPSGVVEVRRSRCREVYRIPLNEVADLIADRVIRMESSPIPQLPKGRRIQRRRRS